VTLKEIARLCGASHHLSDAVAAAEPARMTIDSREIRPGDLFVALTGERSDGHQFVAEVFDKGALAALVIQKRLPFAASLGDYAGRLIFVENTACALQQLAARLLAAWPKPVIGITGSAGKTTIKDLTAAVLGRAGRVLKTAGNLNTTYGLPLMVSRLITGGASPDDFDFAVLEMGMNSYGEIARLADMTRPAVGVVGNVGVAHIEFFGTQDAIAQAKAELVEGIRPGGTAVLNADDPRVIAMRKRRQDLDVISFGIDAAADVTAREIRQPDDLSGTSFRLSTPAGEAEVAFPLIGRHNVANALAAAAVGVCYQMTPDEIAAALSETRPSLMRGEVLRLGGGVTVIDDSYNSNPPALVEAVRAVSAAGGFKRRIVVAGEMLELGARSEELHRACGREIAALGVDLIIGVRGWARELIAGAREGGALSEDRAIFCETTDEATERAVAQAQSGDLILVKGSRGVRTERVVDGLKTAFGVA
jgi:UDP-N-acetylmuramoyl-tripeptide--D-alanyl-D-alanine ligase